MKRKPAFVLILILTGGFLLRLHNYAIWPREGATFDEHAWTWVGLSLLETGVPTSWSPHRQYELRVPFRDAKGASYTLVTPYLEHPPLFGLIAGTFAKIHGVQYLGDISLPIMRRLSLILGLLSILGVFFLGRSTGGDRFGLIASGIYSVVPTVAVGSRLLQNENFFIPVLLFSLYFFNEYLKTKRRILFYLGLILVSIIPLAKIPWIAASAAGTALLVSKRKYKDAGFVILVTLFSLGLFLLWGLRWNPEVFINLWKLQLARYDITFDGIYALFTMPMVSDRMYLDGWIYAGWASMLLLSASNVKKMSPIFFGFLAYFGMYLLGIPNEPGHGWYRFPFYPFLAISLSWILNEYFNKNHIITFFFLLGTGLSLFALSWQKTFGFSFGVYRGFIVLSSLGLLPVVFRERKVIQFSRLINYTLLICVVLLTVWSIFLYTEQ